MNGARGFTLIELIVTVGIVAVLVAVAVPSFRSTILSNRLSTSANEYVAALNQARLEAVRRNLNTIVCGSSGNGTDTLGKDCAAAGEVRVVNSGATVATVIRAQPATASGLTVKTAESVRFGGQGLGHALGTNAPLTALVTDLSVSSLANGNRRCVYLTTGSIVRTCVVTHATTCPTNEPNPCS